MGELTKDEKTLKFRGEETLILKIPITKVYEAIDQEF
jgi:hypothetical protein